MQGGSTNGNISFFSTIAGAVFDDGDGDGDGDWDGDNDFDNFDDDEEDDDDDDDDDKPRKSVSKSSSSKGDGLSDGAGRVVRSVLSDLDDDDDDNGEDDDEPDSTQPKTVTFNKTSLKYHRHSCRWARRCTTNCTRISEREAIKRRGIPCKSCIGGPGADNKPARARRVPTALKPAARMRRGVSPFDIICRGFLFFYASDTYTVQSQSWTQPALSISTKRARNSIAKAANGQANALRTAGQDLEVKRWH